MATPHLAGSAAVVLGQHPSWPAWAVRSAVVNTADENVLKTSNGTCCDTDVNDVGSGRENLGSAVSASLAFDPVSHTRPSARSAGCGACSSCLSSASSGD